MSEVPQGIIDEANLAIDELLPSKSRARYDCEYNKLKEWMLTRNAQVVTEEVILAYLLKLSTKYNPASLWSKFSMVKMSLYIKDNIDIKDYKKCVAFLKRKSCGYTPNKSKVLTGEDVTNFMTNAPDESWLLAKVVLTFGIFGSCRVDDLEKMRVSDVNDNGQFLVVFLQAGKTNKSRSFVITNKECSFNACDPYRKYSALRPKNIKSDRLFVGYRKGKCINQNVGRHTLSSIPKKIATFLNLDNPEQYTGHCLRRSSASILVESGADLLTLKRHGGWKSSTAAEGYIEDSNNRKLEVANKMFPNNDNHIPHAATPVLKNIASTSSSVEQFFTVDDLFSDDDQENTHSKQAIANAPKGFNISGNTNCTFNININM